MNRMKTKSNEPLDVEIAVRILANAVGLKWKHSLDTDCDGLGHIHDIWNEMYKDMDAIVSLEKYITKNTDDVCSVDYGTPKGFEKYDREVSE